MGDRRSGSDCGLGADPERQYEREDENAKP
jgi:hypothetical protein